MRTSLEAAAAGISATRLRSSPGSGLHAIAPTVSSSQPVPFPSGSQSLRAGSGSSKTDHSNGPRLDQAEDQATNSPARIAPAGLIRSRRS